MKVLSINEFSTTAGTGKETEINLDTRSGVFFKIITATFETPLFTKDQKSVPAIMNHADRSQQNVSLTINNNILTILQGYQQAGSGYLISIVADDWADTSEVHQVYVDSMEIEYVKVEGISAPWKVSAAPNNLSTRLTTIGVSPGSGNYFSQEFTTKDGKTYICPISLFSHQISSDPVRYDYAYADVQRVLTAYIKP